MLLRVMPAQKMLRCGHLLKDFSLLPTQANAVSLPFLPDPLLSQLSRKPSMDFCQCLGPESGIFLCPQSALSNSEVPKFEGLEVAAQGLMRGLDRLISEETQGEIYTHTYIHTFVYIIDTDI